MATNEIVLTAKDGKKVKATLKAPTPRLLEKVLPISAAIEEECLNYLNKPIVVRSLSEEDQKDLEDILQAIAPPDTKGEGEGEEKEKGALVNPLQHTDILVRLMRIVDKLTSRPWAYLVKYYIEFAEHVVELPPGVEIEWEEQHIEVLHSIFQSFRSYL